MGDLITDEIVEAAADGLLLATYGQELPEAAMDLARAALHKAAPLIAGRAQMALLEEMRTEVQGWHVYDTRDIGSAFMADSVVDLIADRIEARS